MQSLRSCVSLSSNSFPLYSFCSCDLFLLSSSKLHFIIMLFYFVYFPGLGIFSALLFSLRFILLGLSLDYFISATDFSIVFFVSAIFLPYICHFLLLGYHLYFWLCCKTNGFWVVSHLVKFT